MRRTHIVISEQLVAQIDTLVGKRGRSNFLTQAAEKELMRLRQIQALQAAGFTVTGARNLDQATLRESFREFVDQLAAAGPDAVAFVYLAGFGLQFEGENYFVPVDADPQRDVDIPLQAVRMSDFMQPLAALPGRVKIVLTLALARR